MLVARGRVKGRDVEALTDVSFAVEPGEAVGLIGRNGSGKTTLLKIVAGIIKPTDGRVAVGGRIGSLLELGAGFHPEFTGRENVYLNGSILGLKREVIRRHMAEIEAFSELERFMELPVRTYSSGMVMRLGFAVAAHLEVDVLLLDEVFAVGDEEFQRKCFGKIHEFKQRGGTIVFVSHDAAAVERLCSRAVLLREGRLVFDGPVHEAITRYHAHARRRARSGGARRRPQRVRKRRGADRRGDAARRRRGGAQPVLARRDAGGRAPHRLRAAGARRRGSRTSSTTRPACSSAGGVQDTAELGWGDDRTEHTLRLEIDGLPLADGRFRFRFELADAAGAHLYHWLDDAARFVVYPANGEAGLVRARRALVAARRRLLEWTWNELQDLPRLARPDGARAGAPVQALHGPRARAPVRRRWSRSATCRRTR